MKRLFAIIFAVAALLAAEKTADAQLLKKVVDGASTIVNTEKASTATSQGKAAGMALNALYKTYKAQGKIDVSNVKNITDITTLTKNLKGLKGQSKKSDFYKEFLSGLISGSNDLVTEKNSATVMNSLMALAGNDNVSDLSELTSKTSKMEKASEALDSLYDILNAFNK